MRTCCVKLAALLLGLSFFPIWNGAFAQNTVFVDHAATGTADGSSWTNAFTFLQDALSIARAGDEIWVAVGVYKPDQGNGVVPGDREASFVIQGGVSVFGGFSGLESSLEERDLSINVTFLSGDLLENDDELLTRDNPLRSDNSNQIVRVINLLVDTTIDGFTITGGTGTSIGAKDGSALYVASYNPDGPPGHLYISNCTIVHNVAGRGAVHISIGPDVDEPVAILENSVFRNNRDGLYVTNGTTLVRNVWFTENQGPSIEVYDETVYVIGSTISHNNYDAVFFDASESGSTFYMWNNLIAQAG